MVQPRPVEATHVLAALYLPGPAVEAHCRGESLGWGLVEAVDDDERASLGASPVHGGIEEPAPESLPADDRVDGYLYGAEVGVVPVREDDPEDAGHPAKPVPRQGGDRSVTVPPVSQTGGEGRDGIPVLVRAVDEAGRLQQRYRTGHVPAVEALGVEPGDLHGTSKPPTGVQARLIIDFPAGVGDDLDPGPVSRSGGP